MALDLFASVDALAAKYAGLANSDGSDTLRASHGTQPGPVAVPCAYTSLTGLRDAQPLGGTGMSGTALLQVEILLSPAATLEFRYAAAMRWVGPAFAAALTGNTLAQTDALAGVVPVDVEVELATDQPDRDGLPWDVVRVRYEVDFRLQRSVTP